MRAPRFAALVVVALGLAAGCTPAAPTPDVVPADERPAAAVAAPSPSPAVEDHAAHARAAAAQPTPAVAPDGARHFGRELDRSRAVTPLATVLAEPTRFADQVVKTEGEITRVCQSMGCWMELRAEVGGQAVHVPMAGHAFFLPRDVAGKRATIEGRVSVQERSPEQVAHLQAEGSEVAALALSIEAAGVEVR